MYHNMKFSGQNISQFWYNKMVKKINRYTPKEQSEIREATLLLRFRRSDPTPDSHKYVSYSQIAKVLGIPYNSV